MPHKHGKLDIISQNGSATISTLAARTGILMAGVVPTQNFAPALYQGAIYLVGAALDEGVLFGVCSTDLTLAELEEALEAAPTNSRDTPATDFSRRDVQLLSFASSVPQMVNVANRLPMTRENEGQTFFVYNASAAAMTTGGVFSHFIRTFGRWKD